MRTTGAVGELVAQARAAYQARDWVAARETFAAASDLIVLEPDDRYALANCAWWLGDLDAALPQLQDAYDAYIDVDALATAALVALDVGYTLALRGDQAQGSGWLSRAQRLLEDLPDCPEQAYLDHVAFETAFDRADLDEALAAAGRVLAAGRRFDDRTLFALGVVGEGRVLVRQGQVAAGMGLLDEAMLAAASDELDPGWAGNIYCHLMVACYEIGDLRRAGEWTDATTRWCEQMPGAGPFLGICRVHRAQLMHVRGDWNDAEREADRVCRELSHFDAAIVAEAHYLLGELRRQRGDVDGAEAAFRDAHRLGRDPQPGLAVLKLAQNQVEAAAASIRAALDAAGGDAVGRARLLPAAVEIALAGGDLESARAWCDELEGIAHRYGTTRLTGDAAHARGAALLAEGVTADAVPRLRQALLAYQEIDAVHDLARVRRLLATAYDVLGDADAAALEANEAAALFGQLGIGGVPDRGESPAQRRQRDPAGLTGRELEVLGLVAQGLSNQEIAAELVLSVRTVERHLATVYQKLGVRGRSARAAAVGHALRTGLVRDG